MNIDQDIGELDRGIRKLVARWQGEGYSIRPGLDDRAISEVQERLGSRLHPSLVHFYTRVDGLIGHYPDRIPEELINIWPAEELVLVAGPAPIGDCVQFADFLLDSIEYGQSTRGEIVLLSGREPFILCSGLVQLIEWQVSDDPKLFSSEPLR
jgi:hypothetical protein